MEWFLLVCLEAVSFRQSNRQGFDKNLTPQSACAFRAFGNFFMLYMVLWEQVLTTMYNIKKWEAGASLEKHKRKNRSKHKVADGTHRLN